MSLKKGQTAGRDRECSILAATLGGFYAWLDCGLSFDFDKSGLGC